MQETLSDDIARTHCRFISEKYHNAIENTIQLILSEHKPAYVPIKLWAYVCKKDIHQVWDAFSPTNYSVEYNKIKMERKRLFFDNLLLSVLLSIASCLILLVCIFISRLL